MTVSVWCVVILVILNVVGGLFSYIKYSRNEAQQLGRIEGWMEGMNNAMKNLETRMENLEKRLNGFISGWSGDCREE